MYTQYLTVFLLAAARCQAQKTGDLDAIIDDIWGTPTTTPKVNERGPSTLVPAVVTPAAPKNLTCLTYDNKTGECVNYYLCDPEHNTVITDGVGVIDIRLNDGPCSSYMDTCCLVGHVLDTPVTPKPNDDEPERVGCGWRNANGVGFVAVGATQNETQFGEFPWVVAILRIEPVNDNEPEGQKLNVYVGGGSLIHPSVVLTAAHYVYNANTLRVRGGEWDTQNTKEPYPYQDRDVASVAVHEDFNTGNLFYDVAVLFLAQPMDMAPNVGVVCLPPPKEETPAGTRCFAAGWGKDKFEKEGRYQVILKKIEVPVVDHKTCEAKLRQTRLGKYFQLHSSFMCAGGEAGQDTCKGDGGSPLACPIQDEPGRYMQSGIVAWGIGCGGDGTPGVYVNVANLRDWIDSKVSGKGFDRNIYKY